LRTKFHILFSIEVLHTFFSTGRWNQIQFVPTPETAKLLREYELTLRQVDNELLVITKVDGSGKVYHDMDLYTKFSFIMVPQSAGYLNFSNITFATSNPPVFNFHNLIGNESFGRHFITQTIKDYTGSQAYFPGDFVKGADGKIYESIAKNNGGGSSVVPDNSTASKEKWVQHGDVQFVSAADTKEIFSNTEYDLEQSTGIYNFKTSVKQKEHSLSVYTFSKDSLQYDKEVLFSNASFDSIHDLVQVDLRSLASGKYRIRVNDDIRFVYLVNEINHNTLPIFIDIFNLPAANPQAIVDGAKKPKRTKFTIALAARRVLWNYSTRTDAIDKIEDTDGEIIFQPDGLRKFISKKPIPFSESPRKTLVAKSGALTISTHLPNPQADKLLDKKNDIYTTATFINY